jgi:CRP/FNR family transcriptional regulator, cyclic AMP receptor protein
VVVQDDYRLQTGFLQSLSPSARIKLIAQAELVHFEQGEVIFRQNDPSRHLYIIKEGGIAIELYLPPRGVRRILTLGPGEVFSWSALIEPRTETATARAIESTDAFAVKGKALLGLCLNDCPLGSEIYRALATAISTRLKATQLQLLDMFGAD